MAYRRRHGITKSSTFKEELNRSPPPSLDNNNNKDSSSDHQNASSTSLAAQAIKASAARRNTSLSFAFNPSSDHQRSKSFDAIADADSGRGDPKSGFWGVLAQKAKSILDDDNLSPPQDVMTEKLKSRSFNTISGASAPQYKYESFESSGKMDSPALRKGLDVITSSLNQLGDTFEKAFEEGRTIVESKTADLRTQIRRKGNKNGPEGSIQASGLRSPWRSPGKSPSPSHHDTQLKASRDVAMATAAKAKLLLRELKTVKADLAFARARCAQLEEENKLLREREGSDKGQYRADDDLIRLQLETLLAEKARLASENEVYARENRFLREIVEYHQLTMQDVVYLDEGMEEVTEVYPIDDSGVSRLLSLSPHSSSSPPSPDEVILQSSSPPMLTKEIFIVPEEGDSKSTSEDEAHLPSFQVKSTKYAK